MYDPVQLALAHCRAHRNAMLIGLVALGGLALVFPFFWSELGAANQAPVQLTAADLAADGRLEALSGTWVTVPATTVHDPGVRRTFRKRRSEWTYRYLLVPVGDRFLVVEHLMSHPVGPQLTGRLHSWGNLLNNTMRDDIAPDIYRLMPATQGRLLPVQLVTHLQQGSQSFGLKLCMGIFGVPALILVVGGAVALLRAKAALRQAEVQAALQRSEPDSPWSWAR